LRTGVARLYRRFRSMRGSSELGDAALDVLVVLSKTGPLTLTALSERQRVTPPTMSQIVNRLTADDYVERRRDPDDGRRVLIATTPAGDQLLAEIRARGIAWLDEQLTRLDDDERATLATAARLLREIAEG
jgi:DNA-binding MarR family transcriptional regulator